MAINSPFLKTVEKEESNGGSFKSSPQRYRPIRDERQQTFVLLRGGLTEAPRYKAKTSSRFISEGRKVSGCRRPFDGVRKIRSEGDING